jgi:hypothetical protein
MCLQCITGRRLDIVSLELYRIGTLTNIQSSIIRSLVVTQIVQQMEVAPLLQVTEVSV